MSHTNIVYIALGLGVDHVYNNSIALMKVSGSSALTVRLTTLTIEPGFWIRSTFTTWYTSTARSVLHCSIAVAVAQNIPLRPTVSLYGNQNRTEQEIHTNFCKYQLECLVFYIYIHVAVPGRKRKVFICQLSPASL